LALWKSRVLRGIYRAKRALGKRKGGKRRANTAEKGKKGLALEKKKRGLVRKPKRKGTPVKKGLFSRREETPSEGKRAMQGGGKKEMTPREERTCSGGGGKKEYDVQA